MPAISVPETLAVILKRRSVRNYSDKAVDAGWLLWGIPGMFLALPVMAMLKVLFEETEGLREWGLLLGGQ